MIGFIHDSHDLFYRHPFGAVTCGTDITIRCKIKDFKNDTKIYLRLWLESSYEQNLLMRNDKADNENSNWASFSIKFTVSKNPGWIWYYFIVDTYEGRCFYGDVKGTGGEGGFSDHEPPSFQITVYDKHFDTPDWLKNGIMYQIFTDRFYKGTSPTVLWDKRFRLHKDWYERPEWKTDNKTGLKDDFDVYGGTLHGIIDKLPYLKELGITVLYLNPIFESHSNHKYNTANYMKIDPMYGNENILKELCRKAKTLGISIILDGVFSHTGSDSIYFNKEKSYNEIGAYQSKESIYYCWYDFIEYPDRYKCWWGIPTLPEVNEMNKSYIDYIINNEDSVINHYLKCGIHGWRLDVADELPDEFIKILRKKIKSFNKDITLIGEVWEDPSHKESYGKLREYVQGNEFDSIMNYPFRKALLDFFIFNINGYQLNDQLLSLYQNIPLPIFYSLMNLVGSHDCIRVLNILANACDPAYMAKDEQRNYHINEYNLRIAVKRLKMVSLFQMTFPGLPSIYYGDEAGLEGYGDPFNRSAYPWGRENTDLLEWYKKVISLRKKHICLRTGEWMPVFVSCDTYGFIRKTADNKDIFGKTCDNELAVILFNRNVSENKRYVFDFKISNTNCLYDVINNKEMYFAENKEDIIIPPLSGILLMNTKS